VNCGADRRVTYPVLKADGNASNSLPSTLTARPFVFWRR